VLVYSGGLIGYITGDVLKINNSYYMGSVYSNTNKGSYYSGGLLGYIITDVPTVVDLTNCYAVVKSISGSTNGKGTIFGYWGAGTNTSVYYRCDVASVNVAGTGSPTGISKISINKESFIGWDFVNIWDIASGTNEGYPFLRTSNTNTNTCNITFNANGGTVSPSSASQASGTTITLPTPTRNGYTFNGWYSSTSGGTKYGNAGASYIVTSNLTMYAQWTSGGGNNNNFTLTFNANGGTVSPSSASQASGTTITLPTPTRNGYTFNGWYSSTSGGTKYGNAEASYTVNSNLTMYAQWTSNGGGNDDGVQLVKNGVDWTAGHGSGGNSSKSSDNPVVATFTIPNTTAWAEAYPNYTADFTGLKSVKIKGTTNKNIRLSLVGTADAVNWTYSNYMVELSGSFDTTITIDKFRYAFGSGPALNLSKVTGVSIGNSAATGDYSFNISSLILMGLSNGDTPVRDIKKSDGRYGIKLLNNIVSQKAQMQIILPKDNVREVKLVIYDNIGNVVFEKTENSDEVVWDLTNSAGRLVANGTYLAVADVRGNKDVYRYSAKIGIKR
jgi:uncharacterized repeat protein (TIGR02543 family)